MIIKAVPYFAPTYYPGIVPSGFTAHTRETVPGKVFSNYDADGNLVGVEVLAPGEYDVPDKIDMEAIK